MFLVSLILLPLGPWFLHRVPWAQTVRPHSRNFTGIYQDGAFVYTESRVQQHSWWIRLLYIVLVGWWWGAAWLVLAWLIGLLIVTLPISIMMIDRSAAMVSLQKN